MVKIKGDKFKTRKGVFDNFTINTLKGLEAKGFFDIETLEPLFIGKESNVFIGTSKKGRVAIKIYRLENCDFNRMYDYIKLDPRFKVKRRKRDIILMWVQREFRNLMKSRDAGVKVPTPFVVKNNVLVMELIEGDKVKDDIPKDIEKFYTKLVKEIKKLIKAKLVHADLSQFNILNVNDKPVLIDFSQSTTIDASRAKEYLERDLRNINNFFKKHGIKEKALKTVEDFL